MQSRWERTWRRAERKVKREKEGVERRRECRAHKVELRRKEPGDDLPTFFFPLRRRDRRLIQSR